MTISEPTYIKSRPIWGGYRVPFFVVWHANGKPVDERTPGAAPSFPVTDHNRAVQCRKQGLCWICGLKMGAYKAFVAGPGSTIQKTSIEPPCHKACAEYAVQVCPFMVNPDARFRSVRSIGAPASPENAMVIEDVVTVHPGVCVIYITRSYEFDLLDRPRGLGVYRYGPPEDVQFWMRGKRAGYKELVDAFHKDIKSIGLERHLTPHEIAWRVRDLLKFAGEPA